MNNKLNNIINDFLANTDAKNEEELNQKLQDLMMQYNMGQIEYENTPLDDAYELLEQAEQAKTKKQAIKLAKEAYEKCDACFDAILFQVEIEENWLEKNRLLDEGLEYERKRLEKERYFTKDNIGHFYGIFETRPYIIGLYEKANLLCVDGKIKQARDVCKEILKLNKNDNTGARYLLMATYAYLEEEHEMLKLYQKYEEENLEMLFPLFALYYKLGNDDKANDYLERIMKANPSFLKLFKGTLKVNCNIPESYYQNGDSSEVIMYIRHYSFLVLTMSTLSDYVLENTKKKRKK